MRSYEKNCTLSLSLSLSLSVREREQREKSKRSYIRKYPYTYLPVNT